MTYQDKAKAKAREKKLSIVNSVTRKFLEAGKTTPSDMYDLAEAIAEATIIAFPISQTITDLLDELEKEMGEEQEEGDEDCNPYSREAIAHNTLHRKLTKKLNQIRI